jgi:hypothetical protein
MDKPTKIPLIYGYTVCLVAVICFLISVSDIITAISNLSDPFHADRSYSYQNLASFESYKMDVLKYRTKETIVPDDQSLRTTYESLKADMIQNVSHSARRSVFMDSSLIFLCVVFFVTHWIWIKKIVQKGNSL